MTHIYLSDEWFAASEKVKAEVGEVEVPPIVKEMRVNLTIVGGPEGDKDVHMAGGATMDPGHIEGASTKLTVPFEVAKAMFVFGDASAAMNALARGQVKIEGDMSKVMALQAIPPTADQQLLSRKLQEITA